MSKHMAFIALALTLAACSSTTMVANHGRIEAVATGSATSESFKKLVKQTMASIKEACGGNPEVQKRVLPRSNGEKAVELLGTALMLKEAGDIGERLSGWFPQDSFTWIGFCKSQ